MEIFKLEDNIGFYVTKALQALNAQFSLRFSEYGITPSQYGVLAVLWEEDGVPQKALVERIIIDGATITGILDRLEKNGFVTRQRGEKDRRTTLIYLTEKGRKLREILTELAIEVNKTATLYFSPQELEELKKMLIKIKEACELQKVLQNASKA